MTAVYGVKVTGLDELQRRLEKYPAICRTALKVGILAMAIKVEGEVKRETPVHTGHLRSSIGHRVVMIGKNVSGVVSTPVGYAPPVELGSEPHWPPIKPIKRWAHLVLGDEKAGYLVARAISKRGTKPRLMFKKGLAASQKFIHSRLVQARDEIAKKVAGGR